MVLMSVNLNNIYGFDDFKISFSYPRKLANSTIKKEYLKLRPNFKYKKAVVFMGANATGKTTFGRALNAIFGYMNTGNPTGILNAMSNPTHASFSIDFVNNKMELIRFNTVIEISKTQGTAFQVQSNYALSEIRQQDSYESCCRELDKKNLSPILPSAFATVFGIIGYRFNFSQEQNQLDLTVIKKESVFLDALQSVIGTLDPSLSQIEKSTEFDDSFIIKSNNSQILIQKGELQDSRNLLSTGTKEGIHIAILLAAIKQHLNGFYYCDEQFSHIQTNIEKRLFSLMVDSLADGEQLFFTTHNSDMQDLNIPKHSFAYFRKKKENGLYRISVTFASDKLKRDTDSVKCAAENDFFDSLPDESLLDSFEEEYNEKQNNNILC